MRIANPGPVRRGGKGRGEGRRGRGKGEGERGGEGGGEGREGGRGGRRGRGERMFDKKMKEKDGRSSTQSLICK